MKRLRLIAVLGLVFVLVAIVSSTQGEAQRGYGRHHGMWGDDRGEGTGYGWNYCPYCGREFQEGRGYGMGPGMMHPDYDWRGRGPGMMGPGYDRGYHYRGDPGYRRFQEPLKEEDAKGLAKDMLRRSRNPNLKLGDVKDKKDFFEFDILTQDGSLVDKLQVDKETGMMRSAY